MIKKGDLTYMLVDDDLTNNLVCKLIITKFDASAPISVFSVPEKALEYIENLKEESSSETPEKIILFLDVNMPTMTGWEFLDKFLLFPEELKSQFFIYILSSAIDDYVEERNKYPFVKDFLSKPLRNENLINIEESLCAVEAISR